MSDESALQNIRNGVSNVKRVLRIVFACLLIISSTFGIVFAVALINEPYGWLIRASSLVAVGAAGIIYRFFPKIRTETVVRFGISAFLVAFVLATLTNTVDPPTSGSLYHIVRAVLNSIAALAIGYVVVWTDDWRDLLPSVLGGVESSVVDYPPECPSNRRVAVATSPLLAAVAVVDETQDLVAVTFSLP